jgi:hypothetical protein
MSAREPDVLNDVVAPLELLRTAMDKYLAHVHGLDEPTWLMLAGCERVIRRALADLRDVHNYIVDETEPKARSTED